MLFSGDPNTTEDGCDQFGPRAAMGDPSGKNHNELLECDNWDFGTQDWGQASFLQGAFTLGHSPFSDDGGWLCDGNEGPEGNNPCVNSTVRGEVTFKNTPGEVDMRTDRDWVFSFNYKIDVVPGDTYGNDKITGFTRANDGGEVIFSNHYR